MQIYSWRKWETLAGPIAAEELKGRFIALNVDALFVDALFGHV